MIGYSLAASLGVLGAATVDLLVLRTALLGRRAFWVAYAIVFSGQLVVNGVLTGLPVVRYDPDVIIGWRLAFAPVEDVLFGFAMVLFTLSLWVWWGRRGAPPEPAPPPPVRRGRGARARPGRGG